MGEPRAAGVGWGRLGTNEELITEKRRGCRKWGSQNGGGRQEKGMRLPALQGMRGLWQEAWEEGRSDPGMKRRWTWGSQTKGPQQKGQEKGRRGDCRGEEGGGGGSGSGECPNAPGALANLGMHGGVRGPQGGGLGPQGGGRPELGGRGGERAGCRS